MDSFQTNELVWVKLGRIFWPAVIKDKAECSDFLDALKNEPIAVAEFFDNKLQDVYKMSDICRYNCEQKQEIILKGMQLTRSRPDMAATFKYHVVQAERMYDGDVHVLSKARQRALLSVAGEMNAAAAAAAVFSPARLPSKIGQSASNSGRVRTAAGDIRLNITHPRFVAASDYRCKDLIQQCNHYGELDDASGRYACHQCDFRCTRVNVIVQHVLWHVRHDRKRRANGTAASAPRRKKKNSEKGTRAASYRCSTAGRQKTQSNAVINGDCAESESQKSASPLPETTSSSSMLLVDWEDDDDDEQEKIQSDISHLLDSHSRAADRGTDDSVVVNGGGDDGSGDDDDGDGGGADDRDWWSLVQRRRSSSCNSSSSCATAISDDETFLGKDLSSAGSAEETRRNSGAVNDTGATVPSDNDVGDKSEVIEQCAGSVEAACSPADSDGLPVGFASGDIDGNDDNGDADDDDIDDISADREGRPVDDKVSHTDSAQAGESSVSDECDSMVATSNQQQQQSNSDQQLSAEIDQLLETAVTDSSASVAGQDARSQDSGGNKPCSPSQSVTTLPTDLQILAVSDTTNPKGENGDIYVLVRVDERGGVQPISPRDSCLVHMQPDTLLAYEMPCEDENEGGGEAAATKTAYLTLSQLITPAKYPHISRMLETAKKQQD